MMRKTPVGVGRPGTPVETGPCATRTPLLNSVTFWLPMETTICSGPFGIWPKPASLLGSAFSFLVGATLVGATRALRAGTAAAGAGPQPTSPPIGAPPPARGPPRRTSQAGKATPRHARDQRDASLKPTTAARQRGGPREFHQEVLPIVECSGSSGFADAPCRDKRCARRVDKLVGIAGCATPRLF